MHNKYLQNQKQLLNKQVTSPKIYLGDTTRDTVTGKIKQNHNRPVHSATGEDEKVIKMVATETITRQVRKNRN